MSLVIQPHQEQFTGKPFLNNGGGIPAGGTKHAGHSDWLMVVNPPVKKMRLSSTGKIDNQKYDGPTAPFKPVITPQRMRHETFSTLPTPRLFTNNQPPPKVSGEVIDNQGIVNNAPNPNTSVIFQNIDHMPIRMPQGMINSHVEPPQITTSELDQLSQNSSGRSITQEDLDQLAAEISRITAEKESPTGSIPDLQNHSSSASDPNESFYSTGSLNPVVPSVPRKPDRLRQAANVLGSVVTGTAGAVGSIAKGAYDAATSDTAQIMAKGTLQHLKGAIDAATGPTAQTIANSVVNTAGNALRGAGNAVVTGAEMANEWVKSPVSRGENPFMSIGGEPLSPKMLNEGGMAPDLAYDYQRRTMGYLPENPNEAEYNFGLAEYYRERGDNDMTRYYVEKFRQAYNAGNKLRWANSNAISSETGLGTIENYNPQLAIDIPTPPPPPPQKISPSSSTDSKPSHSVLLAKDIKNIVKAANSALPDTKLKVTPEIIQKVKERLKKTQSSLQQSTKPVTQSAVAWRELTDIFSSVQRDLDAGIEIEKNLGIAKSILKKSKEGKAIKGPSNITTRSRKGKEPQVSETSLWSLMKN